MIERELKFSVTPHDLPKITRALAVAARRITRSTLVSTYFDTEGGRLKKENMTLRVRKEGRRFVQTVRSMDPRAGLAVRGEWEEPVRAATPDLTAAASGRRVRRAAGASPLKPLFTTTVKRSTAVLKPLPTTIIEVAIEEGEIRAADEAAAEPVRQLKLELKSGEPVALYDVALEFLDGARLRLQSQSEAERGYQLVARARTWPRVLRAPTFRFAADASVEAVLQEIGRQCLGQVVGNEPAALADVPEAVHQMRVAVRRLRSALAAVKPMLLAEHYAWANAALKSLGTALDAPRNWDVFAEQLLQPVIEVLPEKKELGLLSRAVERQRRAAYQDAKRAVRGPDCTATILRLLRWFEARAWRDQPPSEEAAQLMVPIGKIAPALIARRFRQATKRSKNFASLSPSERHRLRIALKKLRYEIDLLASLFDQAEVERYCEPLESLQDDLGYVNDVRTAHTILARLRDGAGDLARAGGIVLGWHDHRLVEQEKRLRKHVHRFRNTKPFW
jgi:triphosphatase